MHKTLMDRDIERVLLSDSEIQTIVKRIAAEIDRDYAAEDSKLLLLCILKGSVVFTGDLMKALSIPAEIDFMKVSSYGAGTKSSGRVNIILDLNRSDPRRLRYPCCGGHHRQRTHSCISCGISADKRCEIRKDLHHARQAFAPRGGFHSGLHRSGNSG